MRQVDGLYGDCERCGQDGIGYYVNGEETVLCRECAGIVARRVEIRHRGNARVSYRATRYMTLEWYEAHYAG